MGKSESEWDKRKFTSFLTLFCNRAVEQSSVQWPAHYMISGMAQAVPDGEWGGPPGGAWPRKAPESSRDCSQGEAMLSFQTKHGSAERLWPVRWSPGLALSPLLSTCMTLSKLLSFSEFFSSSGKWDKEWQFLVNRLIVKLSSWWNGVWNTTWYAFSPLSS